MIGIISDSGKKAYGVKELVLDNLSDVENLNTIICAPGSTAIVCSSGDVYILNNQKEWVKL